MKKRTKKKLISKNHPNKKKALRIRVNSLLNGLKRIKEVYFFSEFSHIYSYLVIQVKIKIMQVIKKKDLKNYTVNCKNKFKVAKLSLRVSIQY